MRLVLIRHAHSVANASGVLSGRRPDIHLTEKGLEQSHNLSDRLGFFAVAQLRISPMVRCFETISPWLNDVVLPNQPKMEPLVDENLNEVDYGSWSGRRLSVLSRKSEWKTVQQSPSRMYFPAGEGIAAMQARAMTSVHAMASLPDSKVGVAVSHGDVIKSIVASALGLHLDEFQRIIIDPASVTVIEYSSIKPRILLLNDVRGTVTDLLSAPKRSRNLLGGGAGK